MQSRLDRRGQTLLTLLLFIVLTSACTSWKQKDSAQTSAQFLAVPSTRAFWPRALAVAQEWRPDAYVSDVSVDVPLPARASENSKNLSGVNFYFQSPGEDYVTFAVYCSAEECSCFEVEHKSPLLHCLPITLDDFMLDGEDAIDIGLQQGGADYMQFQTTNVVLKLYRAAPSCTGLVEWYVSFLELSTKTGISIIIDAATGDIVTIRNQS